MIKNKLFGYKLTIKILFIFSLFSNIFSSLSARDSFNNKNTLNENRVQNISLDNNLNNSNNSEININYLKKIPDYNYILGEGDNIEIVLSKGFPEFTSVYIIDTEGTIVMPKIGRIFIKGLTKEELKSLLNIRYKNIFETLSIEINIKKYRPIRFYIDGEVNNPGMYVLESQFNSVPKNSALNNSEATIEGLVGDERITYDYPTLYDAIKEAGGVTFYSNLENVSVIRKNTISNGGGKIQANINFLEIIESYNYDKNIRLFDEDVIYIEKIETPQIGLISKAIKSNLNPSYINVSLSGRVNNPGVKRVSKSSTLNDAILSAGGAKTLKGKINFIRFKPNGVIDQRKFAYKRNSRRGSYDNPYLANGDIIHVGRSFLNVSSEVISEIADPYFKIFTIYNVFND